MLTLTFASIVAPHSPDAFAAEILGRQAAHMVAPRPVLLSRARFDALLDHPTHWTDRTLKLIYNATPMPREQFCLPEDGVLRPHMPRVREFLQHGVSLVADNVGAIAPELAEVGRALEAAAGGQSWANVYLSFQNIGAFGPHYDTTDVFAFHCEGEKTWRLFTGRSATPGAFPIGSDEEVRAHFQREAGEVEAEVTMRPGDVLYIPAGAYHNALAQSAHSLHVTFAVKR
jgi:lysine-specific demethylase/histidyl-hydroxylase NO66